MRLNLIFRKRNSVYFSIEKVFETIIPYYLPEVTLYRSYVKTERAGISSIFRNLFTRVQPSDVYHITGDVHYMALAFPKRKTVLTIHDCIFMMKSSGVKRTLMQWIWLKLPVFKSKAVTVISEATKYDVIKYTGCNPSKVYVIPDPVGEKFTYHPKAFNADRPRILQIGTWPNKNLPRVIEALKDIKAELVIIGEFKEGQEAMLRESGINYKNYYNLTEEELLLQYQNSDILIFATTFEGFGLPIIEAQGIGRIVITSNISPMKEVAGDAAILVDPYNTQAIREAILKAINDDQYREELIRKGLENVKQYNPSVIAHQYLSLYSEIIKNHR